jgi:hypothetical protein
VEDDGSRYAIAVVRAMDLVMVRCWMTFTARTRTRSAVKSKWKVRQSEMEREGERRRADSQFPELI